MPEYIKLLTKNPSLLVGHTYRYTDAEVNGEYKGVVFVYQTVTDLKGIVVYLAATEYSLYGWDKANTVDDREWEEVYLQIVEK